mgnify:CR=1 FL=1
MRPKCWTIHFHGNCERCPWNKSRCTLIKPREHFSRLKIWRRYETYWILRISELFSKWLFTNLRMPLLLFFIPHLFDLGTATCVFLLAPQFFMRHEQNIIFRNALIFGEYLPLLGNLAFIYLTVVFFSIFGWKLSHSQNVLAKVFGAFVGAAILGFTIPVLLGIFSNVYVLCRLADYFVNIFTRL